MGWWEPANLDPDPVNHPERSCGCALAPPVRRRTITGARFARRANDDHNHHSAVACYAARQTSNDELILGKVRQS